MELQSRNTFPAKFLPIPINLSRPLAVSAAGARNSDSNGRVTDNNQQSTKSGNVNGDGIGNDDSDNDDDENKGGGGGIFVCSAAVVAVEARRRWQ